jgi:hypothetical protein
MSTRTWRRAEVATITRRAASGRKQMIDARMRSGGDLSTAIAARGGQIEPYAA